MTNETLTPIATFRWLRYKDEPFHIDWPCGRLQQAHRRPGADFIIWRDVPQTIVERDVLGESPPIKSET